MRTGDGFDDADWRAFAVVALGVSAAAAAHGAAGGVVPGPGGLAVLALLLLPVGLAVRAWSRGVGSLLAGSLAAQVVGHVGLMLVTAGGSVTGTPGTPGGALAAHAHHGAHPGAGAGLQSSPLLGHLLMHLGPGMLAAHAVAAVAGTVLVRALTGVARRMARRFVALLRALVVLPTAHRPTCARALAVVVGPAPLLAARPRRGPPLTV